MSEPIRRGLNRVAAIVDEPSAGRDAAPSPNLLMLLGGGLVASAAVLFFATSSWLVALAFVLGVAVLLGAGLLVVLGGNVWMWRRCELFPIDPKTAQTAARVGMGATLLSVVAAFFS